MYCSACGISVLQGITYCNHCGQRLNLAKREEAVPQTNEVHQESLVWAIVGVFLGGTGVTIGLVAVLKNVLHLDSAIIMLFALFCFLMMMMIETVFIWRFVKAARTVDREIPEREIQVAEIGGANPKALPEPVHSVTDHTTRSFEPVPIKRTSD